MYLKQIFLATFCATTILGSCQGGPQNNKVVSSSSNDLDIKYKVTIGIYEPKNNFMTK